MRTTEPISRGEPILILLGQQTRFSERRSSEVIGGSPRWTRWPAQNQVAADAANRAGKGFTPERQFHMHCIRSDHIALWFKKLDFAGLSVFRRSV
jgi:hypothetical protein